ncbi:MAG TPA: hypothetical protein PLX17_05850 [Chitinophagaceae bacterium]|nr:hypothetical protein [Chitinophagaceae bacterium]
MATINEISNAAQYRGESSLGGGSTGAFEISTRPFELLNAYTLRYKKDQYDQAQIDADEKIKQLAKLTAYDLVNGLEKDKGELMEAQAQLIERRAKEARLGTPSSPKEKMAREVSFQTDIQGMLKKIDAANARKIKLDAYKAKVQGDNTIPANRKELMIKQAEDLFNSTDILILPEIPDHKVVVPKNGDAVIDEVDVIKTGLDGNATIKETIKQFSIGNTWKIAYLNGNGFAAPILPPNATPQQQAEYEQQKLVFEESDIGVWATSANFFNSALNDPNYKKIATTSGINVVGELPTTSLTTEVDVEKVKSDNPIIGGILAVAERYNDYAKKRLEDIKNKSYIDDVTGEKVLLVGGDKESDVKFIDVTKPLKPEDLSFLDMFAKAAPDKIDKTLTSNDNAIQKQTLAETIRNNKADQYLKGKQLKLEEDKWKAAQSGGSTQINGAMERAKRIYADMLKIADSNGVITPDKLRQLNVEQLKYLGIEIPEERDKDGKIITAGGFKPLDLSGKKYGIQLVDGKINVFGPRKVNGKEVEIEVLKDGMLVGNLDNTKSTNLYNIGTNILNEELKNSGAKELNSYMGIDVTGGITTNTDGGGTTTSGSTKTKTEINRSDIPSKAAAAGYSAKEYEVLLKANGVTIKD